MIATYPGTSPTPWCRVAAKAPPEVILDKKGKQDKPVLRKGAPYLLVFPSCFLIFHIVLECPFKQP